MMDGVTRPKPAVNLDGLWGGRSAVDRVVFFCSTHAPVSSTRVAHCPALRRKRALGLGVCGARACCAHVASLSMAMLARTQQCSFARISRARNGATRGACRGTLRTASRVTTGSLS